MALDLYDLAPFVEEERRRDRVVKASGALQAGDDIVLRAIVEQARRSLATRMAAVSIIYQDWQYLIAAAGLPAGPYSRRTSFCGHAVAAPAPVMCVPDALADRRFAGNPSVSDGPLVRFYAGASLVGEEGFALGTLCVFDPHPRDRLGGPEEAQLRVLAGQVTARLAALRPPPPITISCQVG